MADGALNCDDHDACTTEACVPGEGCVYTAISCDDGVACTLDACDAQKGCTHVIDPNCNCQQDDAACNDGDPATVDCCKPAPTGYQCHNGPDPCS